MEPLKTYPIIAPISIHDDICTEAKLIMERKSADYASSEDPFRNFRQIEAMNLGTVEMGIVVRMGDKLSRLAGFVRTGELQVQDEDAFDTCVDLINYTIILVAAIQSRESQTKCAKDGEGW